MRFSGTPEYLRWPKGVLPIAAGSYMSLEGESYRVRETWFILDRHGPLDDGLHVYLDEVERRPAGG